MRRKYNMEYQAHDTNYSQIVMKQIKYNAVKYVGLWSALHAGVLQKLLQKVNYNVFEWMLSQFTRPRSDRKEATKSDIL